MIFKYESKICKEKILIQHIKRLIQILEDI